MNLLEESLKEESYLESLNGNSVQIAFRHIYSYTYVYVSHIPIV